MVRHIEGPPVAAAEEAEAEASVGGALAAARSIRIEQACEGRAAAAGTSSWNNRIVQELAAAAERGRAGVEGRHWDAAVGSEDVDAPVEDVDDNSHRKPVEAGVEVGPKQADDKVHTLEVEVEEAYGLVEGPWRDEEVNKGEEVGDAHHMVVEVGVAEVAEEEPRLADAEDLDWGLGIAAGAAEVLGVAVAAAAGRIQDIHRDCRTDS